MFSLQFIQKPSFGISKKTLDDIINSLYNTVDRAQEGIVNLVFVDASSIQNLNKTYRNIDSPTDVLSFHYHESFAQLSDIDLAWEVIFYEERIQEQGISYGLGTQKEFYKLLIHSLLHLLWYDHETDKEYAEMQHLETRIWEQVFW